MSKLLRLPLTVFAVLAAMLFLPGLAWGDSLTPPAADCAANPNLTGCSDPAGTGTSSDNGTTDTPTGTPTGTTGETPDGTPADQPTTDPPATDNGGGTTGQQQSTQPSGQSAQRPALSLLVIQPPTDTSPAVGLDAVQQQAVTDPTPPSICTAIPSFPGCPGASATPAPPLSCEQLATLLNLPGGCPQSFSCDDLASLFGVTCPAGPPDCATLAALFHLQGCPQPPTSCQEFADLLGVDNCSQIPCLDTSKLPQQARDGLGPLFDGLKNIGIRQCPATTPTTGTTTGTGQRTTTNQPAAQPQPYYANCTDAKAQGVTNIPQGSPGYRPELDSDSDGIACETGTTQPVAQVTTTQPTGKLAYTGLDLGPQLNIAWTLLVLGAGLLIAGRRRA